MTEFVIPETCHRELVSFMSGRYPNLKVIYMSGYTEDTIFHHGISSAELHILHQPFSVMALARKVQKVLEHSPLDVKPPAAELRHAPRNRWVRSSSRLSLRVQIQSRRGAYWPTEPVRK